MANETKVVMRLCGHATLASEVTIGGPTSDDRVVCRDCGGVFVPMANLAAQYDAIVAAIKNESLTDNVLSESDAAYNIALNHALAAISKLAPEVSRA